MLSRLITWLVVGCFGLLGLTGCSSGDRPVVVKGKVTFQGQPVTEGAAQFNDERTGHGAEAELQGDGTYTATLPAGTYKVTLLPPVLMAESKFGPPDPQFKKVKNIPGKYRSTVTSGFTVEVSHEKAQHDFDMKP